MVNDGGLHPSTRGKVRSQGFLLQGDGRPSSLGQAAALLQAKHRPSHLPRGRSWPVGEGPVGCSARQSRSTPSVPSFSQAPRSHTEVGPSGPRSGSGEVPLVSQPGSRGFPAFPSRRGQRCSRPGWMARSGRRSQPMASRGLRAAEEAWGGFGPLGFHLPAPHGNPCSSTPTLSHTTPQ